MQAEELEALRKKFLRSKIPFPKNVPPNVVQITPQKDIEDYLRVGNFVPLTEKPNQEEEFLYRPLEDPSKFDKCGMTKGGRCIYFEARIPPEVLYHILMFIPATITRVSKESMLYYIRQSSKNTMSYRTARRCIFLGSRLISWTRNPFRYDKQERLAVRKMMTALMMKCYNPGNTLEGLKKYSEECALYAETMFATALRQGAKFAAFCIRAQTIAVELYFNRTDKEEEEDPKLKELIGDHFASVIETFVHSDYWHHFCKAFEYSMAEKDWKKISASLSWQACCEAVETRNYEYSSLILRCYACCKTGLLLQRAHPANFYDGNMEKFFEGRPIIIPNVDSYVEYCNPMILDHMIGISEDGFNLSHFNLPVVHDVFKCLDSPYFTDRWRLECYSIIFRHCRIIENQVEDYIRTLEHWILQIYMDDPRIWQDSKKDALFDFIPHRSRETRKGVIVMNNSRNRPPCFSSLDEIHNYVRLLVDSIEVSWNRVRIISGTNALLKKYNMKMIRSSKE